MKKVFISYSHENERTKEYVKKLADRIEEYEEVKVILDQYELELGHDMNNFMETAVREADKILVVCDESYKKKADTREFGAGIETQIISPKVYSSVKQTKVVPLVIDEFSNVPEYLSSRYGIKIINYDLSENKLKEIMCGVLDYKEIEPPKKTKSFFKEMDVKKFEEIEEVEEVEGKFSYMSGPYRFMEYREIMPTFYTEIDEQENNIEEVRLSSLSIISLVGYITGDLKKTPYKKGAELVEFFNVFGKRDVYSWKDGGLPGKLSRKQFVENYLNDFNNTKELKKIIESIVDRREYIGTEFNLEIVVDEINQIIGYDNYKIIDENGKYKLTYN